MARYGVTESDLATPQTWAELSQDQRAALLQRLAAEVSRSLVRRCRRGGLISREQAAQELRQLAAVPRLSNEDRILFSTQRRA
jgi:hypothetical protein